MKRKTKLIWIWSLALVILLPCLGLGAVWGLNAYVEHVGEQYVVELGQAGQADAVVVLGAAVYHGQVSATLARRLDKALEVYQSGAAPKIIVTGDHGTREHDEVGVMREYLLARGVVLEDIFMDHAGFNTYDSMVRAKEVFQVKRAVVVTQREHLLRSLYIADRVGLSAVGVDAGGYNEVELRQQFVREALARVKAVVQCEITKPEPRYLGEPIPVSGSGTATE